MTTTLPELACPDLEPENNHRAVVREWRRDVAAWLRGHGMASNGPVWDAAIAGDRDLASLRRLAGETAGIARHWSGHVPPDAVIVGDVLASGVVVATVTDPESRSVWVTVRRMTAARDHESPSSSSSLADVELSGAPVYVSRGKGDRS